MLSAANTFPFYVPMRPDPARQAARLRRQARGRPRPEGRHGARPLSAGADPPRSVDSRKLNIVWLVSESWRSDMLDPEIMPATHAFATQRAWIPRATTAAATARAWACSRCSTACTAATGSRSCREPRRPSLIDLLSTRATRPKIFTSADFTYPEFDKTIFAAHPAPSSCTRATPTCRAGRTTARTSTSCSPSSTSRDAGPAVLRRSCSSSRPTPTTTSPRSRVIRKPYLENFNYATMDLTRDIAADQEPLHQRLPPPRHAVRARVRSTARRRKLLDYTIVVLTGDHGEEFMEKGRWGHNSTFTDEQTRVPLVCACPGRARGEIDRMTSHLDSARDGDDAARREEPARGLQPGPRPARRPSGRRAATASWPTGTASPASHPRARRSCR